MSADPVPAEEIADLARSAPLTRPRPGHADLAHVVEALIERMANRLVDSCGATRCDLWCLTAPIAVFLPLPDEANIGRANVAPRAAANIAPRAAEPRCCPQLKLHCKSRRSRPTRTTPAVFALEREDSVFRSLCWTSLKHIWGESFASSVFCIIMILPSYSLFICLLKLRSEANHSPSGKIM